MTQEEAREVLGYLSVLEAGLTAWEMDFIESVNAALESDLRLSEKQIAVLEKLEARLLK